MFDLQARIHFEKVEILRAVDDKFHRTGAGVAHRLGQCTRLRAHGLAHLRRQEGARGLFNHFLVAPLDGTFALIEIDAIAMAIRQNLDFDMPGLRDKFFDENPVISKAAGRFILGRLEALARLCIVPCDAHTLATPTSAGLEHHRISNLLCDFHRFICISNQTHIARNRAHTGLFGQFF